MADPVVIVIPINVWVKVATNVTTGAVLPNIKGKVLYMQTVRDTGNPAPTNGDFDDAKELDYDGALISDVTARDVYVAVKGSNPGRVVVVL